MPRKAAKTNSSSTQEALSLKSLFPTAQFHPDRDAFVTKCVRDHVHCRAGDLYAVWENNDDSLTPFETARLAVEAGATAILTEQYLPIANVTQCVVEDVRHAYAKICQMLAGTPSKQLTTIAVTGTHGKTSLAWTLASVLALSEKGPTAGCGFFTSLGSSDSVEFSPISEGSDFSASVASWLGNCVRAKAKQAVVEVSPESLLEKQIAGLDFDIAVITNLCRDGSVGHTSLSNYRESVKGIQNYLRLGGSIVLNLDDPMCRELPREMTGPMLTFGVSQPADVTATVHERIASEQTIMITAGPETVPVRTRIVGDWFVSHCLAATAVGLLRGMELVKIAKGLESLDQIPGRMERIECGQPFSVFVDSASTPDQLAAALEAMREVNRGRVICVWGIDQECDRELWPSVAQVVEAHSDIAILSDLEIDQEVAKEIADGILSNFDSDDHVKHISKRGDAIVHSLSIAQEGDAILVAGACNKGFPGMAITNSQSDDRDVIYDWMSRNVSKQPLSKSSGGSGKRSTR